MRLWVTSGRARPSFFCLSADVNRPTRVAAHSYFLLTTFIQYVINYKWERNYVFVGEHADDGPIGVCTVLKRYDEFYAITLGRPTEDCADHVATKVSITKFFDESGNFARQPFFDVLKQLLARWRAEKGHAKKSK